MLTARGLLLSTCLLLGCTRQPAPQSHQDTKTTAPPTPAPSEPIPAMHADSPTGTPEPAVSSAAPSPPMSSPPPEAEAPVTDSGAAAALEPFARATLPGSKLRLVDAVEAALRAGDRQALESQWLDGHALQQACPRASEEEVASQETRRRDGAASFAECLALADWKAARRLALNYGDDVQQYVPGCAQGLRELEDSEAFYAIGDHVFKVKLFGPVVMGGKVALGRRMKCSAKGGSAAEFEAQLGRFGRRCPGSGWPALTQTGPTCPRR